MTNKELAVQLYTARLQASAAIIASPKFDGKSVKFPTDEDMVKSVSELTKQLAVIKFD